MRSKFTRVVAVAAAVAAASVGLISASASALPPGSASSGAVTVAPLTGTGATSITLTPPAGAACAGDSATGGYRWQTFIASASVDVGTLTYTAAGPSAVAGAVTAPLLSAANTPIVNQTTSVGTALLTGIPTFAFGGFPAAFFPNGAYNIGFACTLTGVTTSFWTAPITVNNAAGFAYSFGAVPAAPVLNSPLTPGNGTLAGTFTEAAAAPAVTGYTVTAVPTAGTTVTLPLAAAATTFTLTGLVNGTSYAVSLVATNTVGNSPASNTVNGTPALAAQPPVQNLAAAPGTGQVALTWLAPATGPAPTGYSISLSPNVGGPFTVGAGVLTYTATGLTAGTLYTFTVTATYAAPDTGTPASITATPFGATVIIQDITVVRPVGNLVLTQRCGVFGALPAEAPTGMTALPALTAVAGTPAGGTAPTLTGGAGDPLFPQYPYPVDANGVPNANYPTHCGVNLGIGKLITAGVFAGQYFEASGRINQVTLVDTRDSDTLWTVNGTMSPFSNGTGSTFSGNYLGWSPQVTSVSGMTFDGYTQVATPGASVAPTGTAGTAGLGTAKVLASAAAGHGLGIATLDSRLKLLIPLTAKNGTYTGTLTFTAV